MDEAQQDRRRRRLVIGMTVLTITLWTVAVVVRHARAQGRGS
ncbi:hypothetical protein ACIPC2_00285 [Curtobacterium pusillum]